MGWVARIIMALIKCPICGNDVSTHSKVCPKCGEPVHVESLTEEQRLKKKQRLKRSMNYCLIEIGIFSGILIVELFIGNTFKGNRIYAFSSPVILIVLDLAKFIVLQKKYEKE